MAKVLKNFDFRAAGSKHPWDEWLDGRILELSPADWGEAQPHTIAMQARKNAHKRGLMVRISHNKETGTLTLQASKDGAPKKGKK